MATTPQHLESIGHISPRCKGPRGRQAALMSAQPAMVLNGVPHYAEADVEWVAERLQKGSRPGTGSGNKNNGQIKGTCE